jgi:hypothetical protein
VIRRHANAEQRKSYATAHVPRQRRRANAYSGTSPTQTWIEGDLHIGDFVDSGLIRRADGKVHVMIDGAAA